jgi:tRNA(fMet)-specific endonuclease VapC
MSGVRVALDTNAAIGYLNGDPRITTRFQAISDPALSATVAGELLFGAANSARSAANLKRYGEFIGQCEVLDCNLETAMRYANLRLQLTRAGKPIPENDLWIAASCLQHSLTLVTNDAHFANCPGLALEDWSQE